MDGCLLRRIVARNWWELGCVDVTAHKHTHTCTHAHSHTCWQQNKHITLFGLCFSLDIPLWSCLAAWKAINWKMQQQCPALFRTLFLPLSHSHACCFLHSRISLSRWVSASEVRSGAAKPEKMLPTKKVELAHVFNDCQRKLLSEHCAAPLCEVAGSSSRAKQARKLQLGELYNKIPYGQL